ncbi:WSCD family member AGAP003962 [Leptidea sinapis]|uniref:WSCD family member AGAP003962 n=1 Tax=Leptidea sinapis TaxID=189913 RepID=UPI002129911C|nr:WSCD family member AGAP003962 [Leptidea sinapis]
MSRRLLLILAACIAVLHFSIIIFMLSPLYSTRSSLYGTRYVSRFGYKHPSVDWCKELKLRIPPSQNVVALVSYPGSGNTWLRYLLQQATGIMTGSVYMDYGLKLHGFPAENVTDGSVLVVKTHETPTTNRKYDSAILLIRNPRDALLADFNRLHKGHIGTAPKSAFKRKSNEHRSSWSKYVSVELTGWESMHRMWLTTFKGPLHIVFYETLVRDTRMTLQRTLDFLNHTVDEEDMSCALAYKEGIYRRKKKYKDFDPYTPNMYVAIQTVWHNVLNMVIDYQRTVQNVTY